MDLVSGFTFIPFNFFSSLFIEFLRVTCSGDEVMNMQTTEADGQLPVETLFSLGIVPFEDKNRS